MKKVILISLFVLFLLLPSKMFAMEFSQPTEIGRLQTKDGLHFSSKTALSSSVENSFYDFGNNNRIVRLYLLRNNVKFGSTNIANSVDIRFVGPLDFYEISSDSGIYIYVIIEHGSDGSKIIEVVGKDKNNNFIKYVSDKSLYDVRRAFGSDAALNNCDLTVVGNTLILSCSDYQKTKSWKYLLKWDDSANWFGIEYQQL